MSSDSATNEPKRARTAAARSGSRHDDDGDKNDLLLAEMAYASADSRAVIEAIVCVVPGIDKAVRETFGDMKLPPLVEKLLEDLRRTASRLEVRLSSCSVAFAFSCSRDVFVLLSTTISVCWFAVTLVPASRSKSIICVATTPSCTRCRMGDTGRARRSPQRACIGHKKRKTSHRRRHRRFASDSRTATRSR